LAEPARGGGGAGKQRSRLFWIVIALSALIAVAFRPLVDATSPRPAGKRLVLWHSQRGAEKDVLEELIRAFNAEHAGELYVEPLVVPDGSFKDKLLRTVPRGGGPDVFIRPHNELGELHKENVVRPLGAAALPFPEQAYLDGLLEGTTLAGERYGAPLTYKALLLFYNTTLLPRGPPGSLEELVRLGPTLPAGTYPLAYDATVFFFHAPFFLAYGGRVFADDAERFAVFDGPATDSFSLPKELRAAGAIPPEPTYNEMIRLFEAGQAAAIVCGPWYTPAGDIAKKAAWDVAPLPTVRGRKTGSFVTVEAAFVSSSSTRPAEADQLVRFLAGSQAQRARFERLSLPPVERAAYEAGGGLEGLGSPLASKLAAAERASLEHGLVTPSSVRMGAVWRPADDVLKASVAGRDVEAALEDGRYTLDRVQTSVPTGASPRVAGILLAALLLLGMVLIVRQVQADVRSPEAGRARLIGSWGKAALGYLAPGVLATIVLVFTPAIAAAGMSLFEYDGGRFVFVGLDNFRSILLPPADRVFEARSFYFALAVTVVWTLLNVVLHVTIGVALALLIRPAWVRFRTGFRLLLVLPWAIPNYITALMWKGMFNAQVGAINALLAPFGFEGYAWFDKFHTAFFANLVTNTWLGFPFMMVVTLGALTSLPKEIEEASILDGASRWQRLTSIVLPHIRPALLPSVILGSVWTFNMFNVVYLVSGGEPGSQTDILVSEAYRWAFERGQRYGYAAAYSVLIFAFLVFYGRLTRRAAKEESA
jgi:arabinogalactan oligomer/maltooligosaccharide transport system permease protein